MSFDRGAPAFWFVEIFLDAETLRLSNAFEEITFDGEVYTPFGDRMTPPADIDRTASLKSQKFSITLDSGRQTDDADPVGIILDANWRRRPVRVRYAIGDMDADGYDFSDPFLIADESGRIKDIEDTIAAGEMPALEMEIESGALVFLERRNQTRSPANQRAAFPGDAFFDYALKLDGVVLPWRTKKARLGSAQITYDVEGAAPREMLVGRGTTKGSFVFGCTVSLHRSWWIQVYALADHQCEALENLYINGVDVLAGQAALEHGVKRQLNFGGEPRLAVTWYDGRHDQTANAELITLTAGQSLEWTSDHRGRGVCYAIIEHRWDSDLPESYAYEFVLKGARIYQERLDTTAGGSGDHRIEDPDTWEFTTNPAEAARHFLRGRVVAPENSTKWFGVGAALDFLDPYATYEAQAEHCEEDVTLQAGGTQKRYEANGWLSAQNAHKVNLERLADCMVADAVDEGGRISIRLSEPQTPVVELTDDDLVSDEETVIGANARADDVVNRIEGRFQDPANKYQAVDYPAVSDAGFEEIDGAELTETWNQPLEISEERAQRKATIFLNKRRRTVELEEHFGPKAKDVRPGDWLTRKSALRGFPSGKTFIADEVRRFNDGTVRLILLEVDPGELAWDEENAVITPPPDDPGDTDPVAIVVPDITVTAISITGGDVELPAVRFTVANYDDFMGDEIECEYGIWNGLSGGSMGIAGTASVLKLPGGFATLDGLAGLLPGTTYAFRFRARDGESFSDWSDFQTEAMTGEYVAGRSAIADAIVDQGPGATAVAADVLNAYVPAGVNQLVDHEFRFGSTYWRSSAQSGSVTPTEGETAGVRRRTLTGSGLTVGHYIQLDSHPDRKRFACKAGDKVEASAYVSGANLSNTQVFITFYNASDVLLGYSSLTSIVAGTATASLADFVRGFVIGTAPANTAYAFLNVRGTGSTSAPVLHVAKPMLAIANASQTAATPWNPGFNAVPGADITANGTAAAITGQGPGATAVAADVLNDALRTGTLFNAALPTRPAIAADFTGSTGSGTPSSIAALTGGTVVNVANEGDVMQFAGNTALSHRGWLPVVASQTYRIRARVRVTVDGTSNQLYSQFFSYNAAGTVLSAHSSGALETDFVAADGWIERELLITGATILASQPTAAFIRARMYGGRSTSGAYSGATWQAAWLRLENVTDELTARARIVDDFTRDGFNWTTAFGGAPGAQADPTDATYQDVANVGRTIRLTNLPKYLQPKGIIRPAIGRRYLVIADVIVTTDATAGTLRAQLYVNGLSSAYSHGAASYSSAAPSGMISDKNPIAAADGEVRLASVFTCTALGTYDAYWRPRIDLTRPSGSGGVIEVRRFRIIDVTDSVVGRLISGLLRDDATTPITEAAVITALGTAGGITGQGALATLNAVGASLLNLADPSNMVADSALQDSAAWATATGWTFGSTDSDVPTQLNIPRAWKTVSGDGTTSQAATQVNYPNTAYELPIEPGKPLRLAAKVLVKAGFTGHVTLLARFGDNTGAFVAAPTILGTNYRISAAGADAVETISGVVLPPSNACFVQFRIQVLWSTTQNNAGYAYVGAPFMQRAAQLGSLVTLEDGTTIGTDALLRTALGTAAAITGQGNLATSNLNRGTTASRPTATGSGSLYANTTTGTVQMDTAAGVWTDIATLSTAVQPRGRILGPAAVNVSNTSTWNVVAQVDLTDIPASAVIQAPYVDAVGQSQDGVSIGAGWQWRLCEAPTSSPSSKTVLKSGNISLTAGASLGGGAYDPPTVDSIDQPSAALVAATNSGAVRYTIEVQRASGSAVVGIQMTANFIINPT